MARRQAMAGRREALGMSQQMLAEVVSVSRASVQNWESGRSTPSVSSRTQLARALQVPLHQLNDWLGGSDENTRASGGGVVPVAASHSAPTLELLQTAETAGALHAAQHLGTTGQQVERVRRVMLGLGASPMPQSCPVGVDRCTWLRQRVAHAYSLRQAARYSALGAVLPDLLTAVAETLDEAMGKERPELHGLAAEANHVAAAYLKKAGARELAWVAVDRAANAARHNGTALYQAAADYRLANLLQANGQARDAERILVRALAALEPCLAQTASDKQPRQLAVWGALLLKRAVVAAQCADAATTWECIGEARAASRRLGAETNYFWMAFGATNVRIHEVSLAVELGAVDRALARGRTLDMRALPDTLLERRARLYLDLARALVARREDDEALFLLRQAQRLAPEDLCGDAHAHAVVGELLSRARGRSAQTDLRQLVITVGLEQ